MKRLLLTAAGLGLVAALHAPASAQVAASFDAGDAVDPISMVEGPGVKVGEGTVLHPVFGVETGVVSNVFYEETNANPAGLLRLLAQVGAGSLGKPRLSTPGAVDENPLTANENDAREGVITNEGAFQYRADLRLSYDFLLSGNDRVTAQGGLGVGAMFRGLVNPQSAARSRSSRTSSASSAPPTSSRGRTPTGSSTTSTCGSTSRRRAAR